VKPVLYIGCPPEERVDAERHLSAAGLSIVWVDNSASAVAELQRKTDMPVLLDLSRGAAALQIARELREHRPGVLLFAVVDNRRPDLTTEAVLTGVADVFARPPTARRLSHAIERETREEHGAARGQVSPNLSSDGLYSQSPSMRDVTTLMSRAAAMRAGVTIRGEEGTGRPLSSASTAAPTKGRNWKPSCSARRRVRAPATTLSTRAASSESASTAGCTPPSAERCISRTSPTRRRACKCGSRGSCAIAKPSWSKVERRSVST